MLSKHLQATTFGLTVNAAGMHRYLFRHAEIRSSLYTCFEIQLFIINISDVVFGHDRRQTSLRIAQYHAMQRRPLRDLYSLGRTQESTRIRRPETRNMSALKASEPMQHVTLKHLIKFAGVD